MATTNQERVAKALELLKAGLAPFVEREIHAAVKAGTVNMEAVRRFFEAKVPDGVPDNVVRTVTENARTLKFTAQGFDRD